MLSLGLSITKHRIMTRRTLLTCIFMLSAVAVCGQRWQIAPDGRGIVWKVGSDIPHDDHIEMSGERMAFVAPLGRRLARGVPPGAFARVPPAAHPA